MEQTAFAMNARRANRRLMALLSMLGFVAFLCVFRKEINYAISSDATRREIRQEEQAQWWLDMTKRIESKR